MNNVNRTLYIPLYGKSLVSRKGVILHDAKAEEICAAEAFELKGKSASKWLACFMGMRAAVFDGWLKAQLAADADAIVLHIGCGLDSRIERVGSAGHRWYDVDFPQVIAERKRYYCETDEYRMIAADARRSEWIEELPADRSAIVVMEGVSMYLPLDELRALLANLTRHFRRMRLLMDCYSVRAALLSKYRNPINDVGVTTVYGIDDPHMLECGTQLRFTRERCMTPDALINELTGLERAVFKTLYAGKLAKSLYRMYEYSKKP